MPRQPRFAKRYIQMATDAILVGKTAHKALAIALGITPTTLKAWLEQQPDFAVTVANARAEFKRRKAEAPAKAGRKSLYTSGTDETARLHAASGKDDAAIAKALGVSITTLRNWRHEHESFHLAIQQGRDTWNITAVEESLVKRAVGYEIEEKSVEEGGKHGKKTTTYIKHIPADTRAAQFVLTNRAPERWKQRQEVEHTGAVGLTMPDTVKDLFDSIMAQGQPDNQEGA